MKTHDTSSSIAQARHVSALLAWCTLVLLCGCVNVRSDRGVEALWRGADEEAFQPGETSRSQVMKILGPPSQILTVGTGSAFYYMLETTRAEGLILLIYNDRDEKTTYDRAVFFFDENELLTDYSLSAKQG
jgi:outer membrane protein assembly factor BamE (lipoprotein component of BamABCDE complex)